MVTTLLVVEDEPSIVALYEDVFSDEHWDVISSPGPGALELARSRRPAVIILDLLLEDGANGWDIRTGLLLDARTRQIPVILVTAVRPPFQHLRAMRVDAVLVKPFDVAELIDAVRTALTGPPQFIEQEGE